MSDLPAFAVKHLSDIRGPLSTRLAIYRHQPRSFTSRDSEPGLAALGAWVYVIEVRRNRGRTTYWLGYRYRAVRCVPYPSEGRWHGRFKYMNEAAAPPAVVGDFFEEPIRIDDIPFCAWYARQRSDMVCLPPNRRAVLDAVFEAARALAKVCA